MARDGLTAPRVEQRGREKISPKNTKKLNKGAVVQAVSNVLTAPIFWNSRNFETERDTPEKHGIKSLGPSEIYQFGLSFLVVSPTISKLRGFEKIRAVSTFETASTPGKNSGRWPYFPDIPRTRGKKEHLSGDPSLSHFTKLGNALAKRRVLILFYLLCVLKYLPLKK